MRLDVEHKGERAAVGHIGRGDPSVVQTVASMQAILDYTLFGDAASANEVRATARALSAENRTMQDYAAVLWEWAKLNVVFQADPPDVEILTTPADMLRAIHSAGAVRGDCKKLSLLLAAMIAAGGWTPALVTCGRVDARLGGEYQHIFAAIRIDPGAPLSRENLYPIDPQADRRTGERTPAGEWPPRIRRLKLWGLDITNPTA